MARPQRQAIDQDRHVIMSVSSVDGITPVPLEVSPTTGQLLVNSPGSLQPIVDFNFIDVQQTSATVDTYVYKIGGSGGTTVRTIVVTYTSSAKTDIDTVSYS